MSTTPPTDPKDPKDPKEAAKKEINSALLWALLAAAFAVYMFVDAGRVDTDQKRNFRYLMGAVGAIVAVVNGYSAWALMQKSKQPPKA
jgi:high-affinity Fe2+/Pb2+ permease